MVCVCHLGPARRSAAFWGRLVDGENVMAKTANRKALLAKIHIAKKELGLDDDTYRMMLTELTGKNSAGKLSVPQLKFVVVRLVEAGFKPKSAKKAKQKDLICDPQSKKIRALWMELHKAGAVRDPSEQALAAYVKRQTKIESLKWLTTPQASGVIESLKQWLIRIGEVVT